MNAMVTSGAPPHLLSPRLAAEPLSSNCGPLPLRGRGNDSWPPLPPEGEGRGEGAAAVRGLFGLARAGRELVERQVAVHAHILWQTEHALGNDIAQDLVRAPPDTPPPPPDHRLPP